MAKRPNYELAWMASPSLDVIGYKIYWEKRGKPPNYGSSSFECGNVTKVAVNQIKGFPNFTGDVTLGLTSVDQIGNESDMVLGNFNFKTGQTINKKRRWWRRLFRWLGKLF